MTTSPQLAYLHYFISQCESEVPGDIIATQANLVRLMTYIHSGRYFTIDTLEDDLNDQLLRQYIGDVIIKLVYDDEFDYMGLRPEILSFKRRSTSQKGWYIPFSDWRSFDNFERKMSTLRRLIQASYN